MRRSCLLGLILLGAAAMVWSWPGCAMPVRSLDGRAAMSARTEGRKKPAHLSSPAVDSSSPTSPVNRLTVNSDSVEAAELWWNLSDELSSKAETLSSDQYQVYIERQAAQLITDNIAEMLEVDSQAVSVKAKTNEAMGFVGRGEGIAALAAVLLVER